MIGSIRRRIIVCSVLCMMPLLTFGCERKSGTEANSEIDRIIEEGIRLYENGNYNGARDKFSGGAKKYPDSPDLANNLGMCEMRLGEFARAEDDFKSAIKNQKTSKYFVNLGNAQLDQEKFDEAKTSFGEAVKIDPTNFFALVGFGNATYSLKDYDGAEKAWQKAKSIQETADLMTDLGTLRLTQSKPDEAERFFLRAIELDQKYAPARYNAGVLNQKQNQLEKAAANYEAAIRIDPSYILAYYNLGLVRKAQGKKAEAIASMSQFVKLAPESMKQQSDDAQSEIKEMQGK